MPKNISPSNMKRMFPFAFYDELNEQLKSHVIYNPAFLLDRKLKMSRMKREEIYNATRDNDHIKTLSKYNIIEIEPFGEVLVLDLCCEAKDVDTIIQDSEKRTQIPISILVCQLYDSAGLPVFANDVSHETIAQIPEVLWDDPNLMLAIVSFSNGKNNITGEAQAGIIKIPAHVEDKFFEPVNQE